MFYPLIPVRDLREGLFHSDKIGDIKLLLIHHNKRTYVIENKCGHFGLPLETGHLEGDTIVCRQHGISFELSTGEISNRPYENAVAVKTYQVVIKDGVVGVELLF